MHKAKISSPCDTVGGISVLIDAATDWTLRDRIRNFLEVWSLVSIAHYSLSIIVVTWLFTRHVHHGACYSPPPSKAVSLTHNK